MELVVQRLNSSRPRMPSTQSHGAGTRDQAPERPRAELFPAGILPQATSGGTSVVIQPKFRSSSMSIFFFARTGQGQRYSATSQVTRNHQGTRAGTGRTQRSGVAVGRRTVLGQKTVVCGVETPTRPSQPSAWGTVVSTAYDGWVENAGKSPSSGKGGTRREMKPNSTETAMRWRRRLLVFL